MTLDPSLLNPKDIALSQPAPAWSFDHEAGPNWAPFDTSPPIPVKDTPQVAALLDQLSKSGTGPCAGTLPGDGSGTKSSSPHGQDQLQKRNETSSKPTRSRQTWPRKETGCSPKRQRRAKRAATKSGNVNRDNEATTHREGSLERNRIAACKCRKRKKKWVNDLKKRNSWLEKRHKDLGIEYFHLLQEISKLKTLIISHASCHDANIDTWLNNEASKYVCKLGGDDTKRVCGLKPAPSRDATSMLKVSWESSQYTEPSNSSLQVDSEDSNTSYDSDNPSEGDFDDHVARSWMC
ncbi:transcription factor atf21 [Metarhizium guizhouense ARSEF 977]|uniref:Transcription factor atf21 n=1 Tax=Metarhizium guizhouense (strain ARSEF 977) TaxID=1276136 RepID=A0A0B4I1G4_METGA|nr:transcription factor atf21 [Metarhizium guizhouense ARSEF 977]